MARKKVISSKIENGVLTLTHYTDPANGEQHEAGTFSLDVTPLSDSRLHNLAAVGLSCCISQRCSNTGSHPDVPAIAQAFFDTVVKGEWVPGTRERGGESEPTDLQLAVAEAMNLPIHVVMTDFEERMVRVNGTGELYRDAAGKPRKFFSKDVQKKLAADAAIAPIMARLAQERARRLAQDARKSTTGKSTLSSLFSPGEPVAAPTAE